LSYAALSATLSRIEVAIMAAKKSKTKKKSTKSAARAGTPTKPKAAPKRAATKKTAPKKAAPKKAAPKKNAAKKSVLPKAAPKKNAAKKSVLPKAAPKKAEVKPVAKAAPPKVQGAASSPRAASTAGKAFADKVRACESGTPVWFTVACGIEHAEIRSRGDDGMVVILTDAGATEVVPLAKLFETAEEARAARSW
jgi:hypothetical protein